MKVVIALSAVAILVAASTVGTTSADARRLGGARVHAHVHPGNAARRVARRTTARVVARDVRRAGRWVNGVWVVNGVAASVAVSSTNCAYYWRKWKETGSTYWHDRWNDHCD